MAHTIEITIGGEGETTVEVKGFKGSGCHALTKALEHALGKTTADTKTPEFFKTIGGQHVEQR